jgi:hypothetical protein
MKRFLAYSLILITLLAGVVSSSTFKSKTCQPLTLSSGHDQSNQNTHQSFFSASDLFLSVGVNNEQIRLSNSLQNFSYRVLPSLLNAFRIQHSIKITQQEFATGTAVYELNSSNKQLNGYYLFHLRKLLI